MPTPALLLLIAVLLPLVSFIVLVFFGKAMGNPIAGYVGTLFIAGSLACSAAATFYWLSGGVHGGEAWGFGKGPINLPYQWIPVGQGLSQSHAGFLDVGIYVDSLTVVMFFMITGIATLVHIFSIGYMAEDKRFPRFFTYLGLFCFSMLGLVIGGTALHLFIFWELVGLCSYLLIGFWYEKKSASNAAIKAFVTNRVGDFGFLIGFGILFYHLGNVSLPEMWTLLHTAGTGAAITLPDHTVFTSGLLTIMGIGLFFGAMGKSAQFPLHVWLPDAMEGPTPVSALIHAATMVAAGVYLCGRIFPILTPDAKLFIAIIGCTTLTMAALIAVAQSDIKKVLAYSTLSQLGYMILAIGVGSWVGALFHLITHAFFKALLFLGSGSVIHAAHHEQELPQYGGLIRKIPVTGITFLVAVFAIAGFGITFSEHFTIAFSGFYSKDMILQHAAAFGFLSDHYKTGAHNYLWLLFWCPTIIAYVTPFYMMRCWTLTFWGKPRNQHLYDHAHESSILYIPLVVLAIAAIIGGRFLGVSDMIQSAETEMNKIVQVQGQPPIDLFATAWPTPKATEHETPATPESARSEGIAEEPGATHGQTPDATGGAIGGKTAGEPAKIAHVENRGTEGFLKDGETHMHAALAGGWAWAIALAIGFLMYMNGYGVANAVMKIPLVRPIHTWLYRRMYFDELYKFVFVGTVLFLSYLAAAFDRLIVDGAVNAVASIGRQLAFLMGANDKYVVDGAVNGAGALAQSIGQAVRTPQTGRVRLYVTVLMCVIAVSIAGAIVVVLSR